MNEHLTIALAQTAPIWLDRSKTLEKIENQLLQAAEKEVEFIAFGEALVPGYPFWLDKLHGSQFNSALQKEIHALYMAEAVQIEAGHLDGICLSAKKNEISVYLGIVERPQDRGGHSLYCSLVYIDQTGTIQSVHRKLIPTYEERLAWAAGDGKGLVTHQLKSFTVGGLNCWENWMPLARTALYAQGEDLHISVWPGNKHNTEKLLPVLAMESRSFVAGVSGVFRQQDIPDDLPFKGIMLQKATFPLANGGSCLAGPDGNWIIEPYTGDEKLLVAKIDQQKVREERQNFDPSGHYSRPDVFQLQLNRDRQGLLKERKNN